MTRIRRTTLAFAAILLALAATTASAQTESAPSPRPLTRTERADGMESAPITTFFLKYSSQPNDSNEILTGLRLMLDPAVKIYLVQKDNAILIKALPDDLSTATKLIADLDRPRKTFRITYTLTEMDGSKKLGTQHYTLVASSGQRVTLKAGAKIPVSTGKFEVSNDVSETQMTYLDVGLNFDATPTEITSGAMLKSKVERSSVAEEKPAPGSPQDPTIRQAVLDTVLSVPFGKPVLLGSLELPDSTHRIEMDVQLEQVP